MLQSVDSHWREHLAALDHLRQGIHLRGYAQKNPKQEYKREAFELFGQMLDMIKNEVVKRIVMTVRIESREKKSDCGGSRSWRPSLMLRTSITSMPTSIRRLAPEELLAPDMSAADEHRNARPASEVPKVSRNDPCPLRQRQEGHKQCHGQLAISPVAFGCDLKKQNRANLRPLLLFAVQIAAWPIRLKIIRLAVQSDCLRLPLQRRCDHYSYQHTLFIFSKAHCPWPSIFRFPLPLT